MYNPLLCSGAALEMHLYLEYVFWGVLRAPVLLIILWGREKRSGFQCLGVFLRVLCSFVLYYLRYTLLRPSPS